MLVQGSKYLSFIQFLKCWSQLHCPLWEVSKLLFEKTNCLEKSLDNYTKRIFEEKSDPKECTLTMGFLITIDNLL